MSIFLGAILAFVFAFFLYVYQKKSQDGFYLAFVISYITSQTGKLYCIKKDIIIERNEEILGLEREINKIPSNNEIIDLKMREISQFIANPSHSSSDVSIEKLSFLADFDPNLILLIHAALDADSGVNEIIKSCNDQLKETKGEMTLPNIWLLIQMNKNLSDQVDYAIGLLEHSQSQLIEFSKKEFEHFVTIRGFSIEDNYKELKPKLDNSLLSIEYNCNKKSFKNRMLKILNRLRSCI